MWQQVQPGKDLLEKILNAIKSQSEARKEASRLNVFYAEWKHPARWLRRECWDDDPEGPIQTASQSNSVENESEESDLTKGWSL